jgi:hypothetical protein
MLSIISLYSMYCTFYMVLLYILYIMLSESIELLTIASKEDIILQVGSAVLSFNRSYRSDQLSTIEKKSSTDFLQNIQSLTIMHYMIFIYIIYYILHTILIYDRWFKNAY